MNLVQINVVGGDKNSPEWLLNKGKGVRHQRYHVSFIPPFETKPNVLVALTHVDASADSGLRISVVAEDVMPSGCDVVIATWGNSLVFGAHASCLAVAQD